MKRTFLLLITAAITFISCHQGNTGAASADGDTVPMHYASNLLIVDYPEYTEVAIRNPWDTTKVLHRYILCSGQSVPDGVEGTVVRVPLQKAAVFTSVHCALLQEMGVAGAIGGVCDLDYIHIPYIQDGVKAGRIANLGSGMDPSIEHTMDLQPDALMPSPFENSGGYGRLEQLGIPIIECADYMEPGPLARAEWMRFYGRLFGVAEIADSLFSRVESRYIELREKAASASTRPRLLCEKPNNGHWYLPGGESTMGQMYRDAAADYIFSDIPGAGSTAMSLELVLDKATKADIWLLKNHGAIMRRQIMEDTPLLRRISVPMWLCDTQSSGFYEETPFHPERLLENLVQILHPELGITTGKSYFCPLE